MDPVTAINFAASIVTFVDFASRLVSGAFEIYKSPTGRTTKNIHVEAVISDLQDVTDDLDTDSLGNSKEAKRLRRLASECNKLAEELLGLLKRLRLDGNQNRAWKSVVTKWITMRRAEDAHSMEEKLKEYRSEILLQVSLLISNQQSSVCAKLEIIRAEAVQLHSQTARDLVFIRERIQQILITTEHSDEASRSSSEEYAQIIPLLQQLQQLNSSIPVQHRILRQLMYNSMHFREEAIHSAESGTCAWILEEGENVSAPEMTVIETDEQAQSKNIIHDTNKSKEESIGGIIAESDKVRSNATTTQKQSEKKDKNNRLVNASFRSTDTGNHMTPKEFDKRSRDLRESTRAQFTTWLRSGTGIFHLCGKAGSGKSTFMKFIRSHPRTIEELKRWAGDKELGVAYFYFSSNTGDESQMSLDSFYRSILFECLSQCPDLIAEVFPSQWRNFSASNADQLLESNQFTTSKIVEAFEILTLKRLNPRYRLCFFIDGLDEYHGDTYEHWNLARLLRDLSNGNDLKICASSRPHTEYLDTFCLPNHKRILLQDLNAYDIYTFSRKLLEKDEKFPQIRDVYLDLAFQLSSRSEGVFLWAVFALRMLLTSLGYGDNPQDLVKDLDIVPEQLDMLFENILASISKHAREQCNKFLCLTMMNPFNTPLTSVSYSWVNELEIPEFPSGDANPYTEEESICREKSVARQLDRVTKGLLEIVETRTHVKHRSETTFTYESKPWKVVQFLHRTFRDFLQEKIKDDGFFQSFPGSTPGEIYGKVRLAEIIHRCPPNLAEDIGLRSVFVANGMYMLSSPSFREPNKSPNKLWTLPIGLTERLGVACQNLGFLVHCGNLICRNLLVIQTDNASFLHLAAASGHNEYIYSRLDKDDGPLIHEDGGLSIVLSALHGAHIGLATELLRRGGSVHKQIPLHTTFLHVVDLSSKGNTAPVWVIVVYKALYIEFVIPHSNSKHWSMQAIRLWEFILQHVLTSADTEEWYCQVVIAETKYFVNLRELVRLLAEYYSSSGLSSYMKEDYWNISKWMTIKAHSCGPLELPSKMNSKHQSDVLKALMRHERFEVRFHDYVMSYEWYYRVF